MPRSDCNESNEESYISNSTDNDKTDDVIPIILHQILSLPLEDETSQEIPKQNEATEKLARENDIIGPTFIQEIIMSSQASKEQESSLRRQRTGGKKRSHPDLACFVELFIVN
ncbi:hypothetical protein RRG08_022755 [Elysia crispata]|uniref:Uncharacterized protein n=1 Tax=Elysia crispata TaxID=231223 RepID=A0AAE0ZWQ1_9GAST|nr:hypothetical protein RRG08_022755 [Elysia crispata]